ncbi:MAG: HDIG domain-containing metalloprotein [Phycisphaeraceae bacterium]
MASKSNSLRRREVRRNIPRSRRPLRELLSRSQVLWGLLMMLAFTAVASLLAINSRAEPPYRPGQVVDRAQVARVQFDSIDQAATDQSRRDARRKTPAVYERNATFFEATEKRLLSLPVRLADFESLSAVETRLVETHALTEESFAALKQYSADGRPTDEWSQLVRALIEEMAVTAFLSEQEYQRETENLAPTIRLYIAEDQSLLIYEGELANVADARDLSRRVQRLAVRFPEAVRPNIQTYLVRHIEPTYMRNTTLTAEVRKEAEDAVEPTEVTYLPDQVLVSASQSADETLTEADYRVLKEHYSALPWSDRMLSHLGVIGLVTLLACGMVGSVLSLRPRVAENPMRGMTMLALLGLTLLLAWVLRGMGPNGEAAAAIGPAMLAAVIVAIAYDQRFAIAVGVLHGLLIGVALDLSVGMYMIVLTACVVAVSQLREVRNRTTLVRAGFVTGIVAAVGVWAAGLAEWNLVPGMLMTLASVSAWAFLASLFVGFFVLGVLPYIERIFKVTTSMTLLELCDVNQPLLRRLAQSAPGTYNHSLQVGTLAEAAAEAIGGNGLLIRVGAYYHDIGKIHKPQYFVENQVGGPNRHEKLSPAMSLLIIVGHVKDGVEMAREYGLPPVLHHFIESHHGTTLVEYFYHAARKGKTEAEQPEETEFRYPGPRPHMREAAILMLCDAVESASRTMAEPTSARIENLVHKLTMKRLMDGQFSQCDLTLADLELIEQAITKSLCAIYHGRVVYPSVSAEPPRMSRQDKERAVAG